MLFHFASVRFLIQLSKHW